MSRHAQPSKTPTAVVVAANGADDGLAAPSDDICPVCKSSRYMNPNMRFLVNPECYHRMCSSCVDRIFAAGRAKCPIARCPKMLRKAGFRRQIFDDVRMEREKDIRGEIAEVFNRREDEFETLRAYNDYLEMVEDVSFGLINGVDVEENRRRLERYRESNNADIRNNRSLREDEETRFAARQALEREQTRLRREKARREETEGRLEAEEGRRAIVDAIASGGRGSAEDIARAGEERLRKSKLRREASEREGTVTSTAAEAAAAASAAAADGTFVIRGLKRRARPEAERAYDPFGGIVFRLARVAVSDAYDVPWLDEARADALVAAGGYDVPGYCQQTLINSFAGLGVFVGDDT